MLVLAADHSPKCCATLFYRIPQSLDLRSAVRDNATGARLDTTLCSIWRLTEPGQVLSPVTAWDAGRWTGLHVGDPVPPSSQMGVQTDCKGSSVVQFANGTFGALLNFATDPVVAPSDLGTITVEYTPSQPNWIYPWKTDASAVIHTKLEYHVPSANVTWGFHALGGPAMCKSLSARLRKRPSVFVAPHCIKSCLTTRVRRFYAELWPA